MGDGRLRSAVEEVKDTSRFLRGTLRAELAAPDEPFSTDSTHLLKFHGIYQQDDRDLRRQRTRQQAGLAYTCMVRTSVPGGVLTSGQWSALDSLADKVGDGRLRVTTRQGIQYHFVGKADLRPLVSTLNEHLVSTLAACGDVVRNVAACPAPLADRRQEELVATARRLAARFRPRTRAYWELWLDGEPAASAVEPSPDHEPIYGDAYLPRKFKIGVAWPGDNCVDVYTHDVGIVPLERAGEVGYVVLIGGGLGMSHAREDDTYPRLATTLGWVERERLGDVVEAVVTTQRDHGNREDRARARLKYTIEERGEAWFRDEVEGRAGTIADAPQLPAWHGADEHLGWHEQADGSWFVGVHIDNGRVVDGERARHRTALREIAELHASEVRLTARQDVLLCGIAADDRDEVDGILRRHGVGRPEDLRPMRRLAMACPALPTCGQALGEAERIMPRLTDGVTAVLDEVGLPDLPVRINVTGCPNGCARPYSAEVGIVGRTKSTYDLYVGGAVGGDRLAHRVAEGVRLDDLPAALQPLMVRYRDEAVEGEAFGDFCDRVGPETLGLLIPAPRRRRTAEEA